jgi:hypothetical protein
VAGGQGHEAPGNVARPDGPGKDARQAESRPTGTQTLAAEISCVRTFSSSCRGRTFIECAGARREGGARDDDASSGPGPVPIYRRPPYDRLLRARLVRDSSSAMALGTSNGRGLLGVVPEASAFVGPDVSRCRSADDGDHGLSAAAAVRPRAATSLGGRAVARNRRPPIKPTDRFLRLPCFPLDNDQPTEMNCTTALLWATRLPSPPARELIPPAPPAVAAAVAAQSPLASRPSRSCRSTRSARRSTGSRTPSSSVRRPALSPADDPRLRLLTLDCRLPSPARAALPYCPVRPHRASPVRPEWHHVPRRGLPRAQGA